MGKTRIFYRHSEGHKTHQDTDSKFNKQIAQASKNTAAYLKFINPAGQEKKHLALKQHQQIQLNFRYK